MPSLLTSTDCTSHIHLIIGHNPLASTRATRSLALGATVKLLTPSTSLLHYSLQQKISDGAIQWIQKPTCTLTDLTTLGRSETDGVVDAVFVTLTTPQQHQTHGIHELVKTCRRLRIPINVADTPALCTFSILSTHTDGPLQIGVTTSGRGCKLAGRVKREIVAKLPPTIGQACERMGRLRRRIWEEDFQTYTYNAQANEEEEDEEMAGVGMGAEETAAAAAAEVRGVSPDEDDDEGQNATFNKLVTAQEEYEAAKSRRIRWLSQICEYWPLDKICALTDGDIEAVLRSYMNSDESNSVSTTSGSTTTMTTTTTDPNTILPTSFPPPPPLRRTGKISLVGSGPGHPSLLTTASLTAITTADLILADKLVPAPILALIPRRTPVHIARKFPGNADLAQQELLTLGHAALKEGKSVVRLKQGDPYVYGRGAEEVEFFRAAGFDPIVVPGITSALSAPLFAGISSTHRGVADQILVCTGTGRKGAAPEVPAYVRTRTTVFLMALHRLEALVESLVGKEGERGMEPEGEGGGKARWGGEGQRWWPKETPCAVIERASCHDQRVVRTTLENVCAAVEEEGSRPPGLLVVGWACEVLTGPLAAGKRWVVEEGFREF